MGLALMSNVKLSDICTIRYGKDHKPLKEGSIPVYGSGGIMRYVDTILYDKKSVLIPRKGTLGNLFYVEEPFWTIDTLFYSEIDETVVIPKYLYYKLRTLDLASMNVGTAVPSLTTALLNEIKLEIPPLSIQRTITNILSSLDDKIENNNAIIANLEEQGLSIFKKWFIESSNPNWKQGTVSDLGTVISGGTPSKKKAEYYADGDIPWITPKDLSLNKSKFISRGTTNITKLGLMESSAKLVTPGTILFSSRAPIGYIAIAKNEVSTNQGFKSIEPYQNIGTAFVYYFLKTNVAMIENSASGSTFKEISGGAFKKLPAIIPDNEILSEFNQKCQSLFSLQEVLEEENTKLMEMRDTLLPKLMSGEIRVGDVVVEE